MIAADILFSLGYKLIDQFISTPEEKLEAQTKLNSMIQNGDLKELELLVKDRDSARKREMVVRDGANIRIGALILIGFFSTLGVLLFANIQNGMKDTLLLMIGSLGTMATQVVAYYFGSSSGSKQKTDMLSK